MFHLYKNRCVLCVLGVGDWKRQLISTINCAPHSRPLWPPYSTFHKILFIVPKLICSIHYLVREHFWAVRQHFYGVYNVFSRVSHSQSQEKHATNFAILYFTSLAPFVTNFTSRAREIFCPYSSYLVLLRAQSTMYHKLCYLFVFLAIGKDVLKENTGLACVSNEYVWMCVMRWQKRKTQN